MQMRRWQRSGWRFGTATLLSGSLMGCDATSPPPDPDPLKTPPQTVDGGNSAERTAAHSPPAAVEPAPKTEPQAPEIVGAVFDARSGLYVQRCGDEHPCPAQLQQAAAATCAASTLGTTTGWRLPTKDEFLRLKGLKDLKGARGYHWTSTAYAEDAAQFWIVARDESPSTTIPGTRKPFTARCVRANDS